MRLTISESSGDRFRDHRMESDHLPDVINCTNLTRDHFLELALARSISAGVCLFVALLILVAVVFIRAFSTLLQRLFVCLTAITAWYQAMLIVCIRPYISTTAQICAITGFLNQWAGITVLNFTFTVSVVLLCKVFQEDIGKLCDCIQVSKNCRKSLEALLFVGLFLLPLLFIWIPFIHANYAGGGEPWCWIVTVNKDCSRNTEGFWEVIGLWYAPLGILGLLIVLSVSVVIGVFIKRACSYRLTRRSHGRKAWETILLLFFLLLFGILAGIEATSNLYTSFTKKKQGHTLYVVHAACTPISKLLIPVGFLLYLYSMKKFRWEAIKASLGEWRRSRTVCCRSSPESSTAAVQVDPSQPATARSSYGVVYRSDTHFSPYTGGFTDVDPTTALISEQTETGYGSCVTTNDASTTN